MFSKSTNMYIRTHTYNFKNYVIELVRMSDSIIRICFRKAICDISHLCTSTYRSKQQTQQQSSEERSKENLLIAIVMIRFKKVKFLSLLCILNAQVHAFVHPMQALKKPNLFQMQQSNENQKRDMKSHRRRSLLIAGAGASSSGWFDNIFGNFGGNGGIDRYNADAIGRGDNFRSVGPTNEVVKVVNGMKHRRLGGTDIIVSELGLGTQRWCSTDFNAPLEEECFQFMDEAILKYGVNLFDTAEQYPIPSGGNAPEGYTETVIGDWMRARNIPRQNVVIASKITGGRYVLFSNCHNIYIYIFIYACIFIAICLFTLLSCLLEM